MYCILGLAVPVYICTHLYVSVCSAVHDADGDIVQCRLAESGECGCVCNAFTAANLTQVGIWTWTCMSPI